MTMPRRDNVLPGLERLVQALDNAVAGRSPAHAYAAVRSVLPLLVGDAQIHLPAAAWRPHPDHYARHVLHHSPQHGYCVVVMTWGPGQGAPLHDHAGLWCAEAVWSGRLCVTAYSLTGQDPDGGCHFQAGSPKVLQRGDCDGLQADAPYHQVYNPDATAVAVSLHVYQALADSCRMYEPASDGRYWPRARTLCAD